MAILTKNPGDTLAFSEVINFFNRGGAGLNFPPVPGFAAEGFNTVTQNTGGTWPNAQRPILGSINGDIIYLGNRGNNEGSGTLQIAAGSSVSIRRVDVGITFTNISSATASQITPQVRITVDGNPANHVIDETLTLTTADEGAQQVLTSSLTSAVDWTGDGNFNTLTTVVIENEAGEQGFSYTVDYIRFSSDTEEYVQGPERLSWYRRDGGIVPSVSEGGGGAPTYPATGGIALDDLGAVQATTGNSNSWPDQATDLMGMTSDASWNNDLVYAPGTTTQAGSIVNNTGVDLRVFNIRCEVEYTNLRGNANINPFFWVRRGNDNVAFPNPTISATGTRVYELTNESGWDWFNGVNLNFILFSSPARNYDYTINYLRINLVSNVAFDPTGTGGGGGDPINTTVPDAAPFSLSHLRNVDDGVADRVERDVGDEPPTPGAQENPAPGNSVSEDGTDLSPTHGPNGET